MLLRLKKKKKNSINQAIELYTPYLSTVLYHMVGTRLPYEDIEEIVADTFVVLWRNADYIDLSKGSLRSYISATARNYALKRLQKQKDYISLTEIELPDKENFTDNIINSEILWESVMALGEPDNEIFVRYYKYNEKLREISAATGLNISTIKTRLSRGKQKLRKILSPDTEDSI